MRILVALVFVLFFYNAFVFYFVSSPRATASDVAVNKNLLNLDSYIAEKGRSVAQKNEFATLLASSSVLGEAIIAVTPRTKNVAAKPTPTPHSQLSTNNSSLKIAILGDSMVDTLGPTLPHLKQELAKQFPNTKLTLFNYGVGASNIDYGVTRLTNDYTYLGEPKPALLSQKPDVVVVESFAYNHWDNTQSDLDRHWLAIDKIIKTIKFLNPNTKIVLSTSIAPHCPTYTDGSANLPPERKYIQCETVKKYLQNMVNFATSQNYPLADAFHPSLSGPDGQPKYINQGDHIHPSDAGKALFAQKVAQAIASITN